MADITKTVGEMLLNQLGSAAEISQNHVQCKETIRWTKKSYNLDAQSFILDALDHSKEEIRSHYETYVNRINTPLLVLALIWPFALNTIQFSDPFVPGIGDDTPAKCPGCIENQYRWLTGLWVYLMGTVLTLPFWGILMLIRCKLKLDSWLEYSLAGLNRERRRIWQDATAAHGATNEDSCSTDEAEEQGGPHIEPEEMVAQLVQAVLEYQDYLARIWTAECGWLVHASTMLLWMSALCALLLTALSHVIFLTDKGGIHAKCSPYFAALVTIGVSIPAVYIAYQRLYKVVNLPDGLYEDEDLDEYPLASFRAQRDDSIIRRNMSEQDVSGQQRSSGLFSPSDWIGLGCCRRSRHHQRERALLSPLMRASKFPSDSGNLPVDFSM